MSLVDHLTQRSHDFDWLPRLGCIPHVLLCPKEAAGIGAQLKLETETFGLEPVIRLNIRVLKIVQKLSNAAPQLRTLKVREFQRSPVYFRKKRVGKLFGLRFRVAKCIQPGGKLASALHLAFRLDPASFLGISLLERESDWLATVEMVTRINAWFVNRLPTIVFFDVL